MKTYNQFLNEGLQTISKLNRIEPSLPIDFKFSIDARNSTKDEKRLAIKEFEKYFHMDDHIKVYLHSDKYKNPVWNIELYESWGNSRHERHSIKFETIDFQYNYNAEMLENDSHNISIKEFLNVGLEGVENYLEMKKNVSKYNL